MRKPLQLMLLATVAVLWAGCITAHQGALPPLARITVQSLVGDYSNSPSASGEQRAVLWRWLFPADRPGEIDFVRLSLSGADTIKVAGFRNGVVIVEKEIRVSISAAGDRALWQRSTEGIPEGAMVVGLQHTNSSMGLSESGDLVVWEDSRAAGLLLGIAPIGVSEHIQSTFPKHKS